MSNNASVLLLNLSISYVKPLGLTFGVLASEPSVV